MPVAPVTCHSSRSSVAKIYSAPPRTLDRNTISGPRWLSTCAAAVAHPVKLVAVASISLWVIAPRSASWRSTAAVQLAMSGEVLHAMIMSKFYAPGCVTEAVWMLTLASPEQGMFTLWLGSNADRWLGMIAEVISAGASPVIFALHQKLIINAKATLPACIDRMALVDQSWE